MGHIKDLWTAPGPDGRVRTDRYGRGRRWQARWNEATGREVSKTFGNKDAARAHLVDVEARLRSGSYIDVVTGQQTFQEYAERWRREQLHHRASTAAAAESQLRLHVYPVVGHMPMSSIRRPAVQQLVNEAAEKLAPATTHGVYALVATVFRSAVLDGVIHTTPCVRINLPEEPLRKVVPLHPEQVAKIRLQVPDRFKAAVIIAAASGLRQGELFGLTVDRLEGSCDNVVLVVDRQRGKRAGTWAPPKTPASDRRVQIGLHASRALWQHLTHYREGKYGHVFSTPRRSEVGPSTAGDVWRAAIDGMGLPARSGWHDLRHLHASLLIASGLSVPAVADRLGHKDQAETFATYSHLWPTDDARAVAAIDSMLSEL